MNRSAIAAAGIALALFVGCKGNDEKDGAAAAEKMAQEKAAAELKQPVALIAAYMPYLRPAADNDKYAPKRRPDEERSTAFVADEIRHAANKGRQALSGDSTVTKELTAVLAPITSDCADAQDPAALDKCAASVQKLDDALKKSEAANAALGGNVKFPRVAPESVTPEAKTAIAPFLKARGPGDATKAYAVKRGDSKASFADVLSACQAAASEADEAATAFEKAAEPIRLIAVTRKMSMDSQCGVLTAVDTMRKDVNACRNKARTPDCKIVCGKVKAKIGDGVPTAALAPMEKEVADICKD